jgi:hypothetical protein
MSESISKLVSYVALVSQTEDTSKLVSYVALAGQTEDTSKLVSYVALAPIAANMSKTLAYVVLQPFVASATFPSLPPIEAWERRQIVQTNLPLRAPVMRKWYGLPPNPSFGNDSNATFDNFSIYNPQNIPADTAVSSDLYVDSANFTYALSDTIQVLDGFVYPTLVFDRVSRQVLIANSANTSVKVAFGKVARTSLISGGQTSSVNVRFAGIARRVLCSIIPSAGTNPGGTINALNTYGAIPVFPALPENYPIKFSPVMDTIIGTTKSLREMRVPLQTYPIWDIEIMFDQLKDQTQNQTPYGPFTGYQQYMDLVQLWLMMYGQTNVFAFTCPWDYSRANQALGTGDGITLGFTAFRTWGSGAQATAAPVGAINNVINVFVNGTAISATTYSVQRNQIVFNNPPAAGAVLTISFTYYYLCRFVEDEQDYEEFSKNRWAVKSLKFRASTW